MPLPVKVGGSFRPTFKYAKINGTWRDVPQVYVKVNGAWRPLYQYSWVAGPWGSCSASCGGGTQTRSVTCQRQDGYTVADKICTAFASGTKPATSQSCGTTPCGPPPGGCIVNGTVIQCDGYFVLKNDYKGMSYISFYLYKDYADVCRITTLNTSTSSTLSGYIQATEYGNFRLGGVCYVPNGAIQHVTCGSYRSVTLYKAKTTVCTSNFPA